MGAVAAGLSHSSEPQPDLMLLKHRDDFYSCKARDQHRLGGRPEPTVQLVAGDGRQARRLDSFTHPSTDHFPGP